LLKSVTYLVGRRAIAAMTNKADYIGCAISKLFVVCCLTHTNTHTHPFNGPFSETTRVSRYQKGKTNLDFTEARDSEWRWHQLGHMQVCT